ncbi:class I SAM-dependent methyltransferase, partial [uncultured Empedobacter sp.]
AELFKIHLAEKYLENEFYKNTEFLTNSELSKLYKRTDIINFILSQFDQPTTYLEIGVRRREDNFNLINSDIKYSVDPGFEDELNDVDFKVTSDIFFDGLDNNTFLDKNIRFDVIFIDGLHLAEQVEKDIYNSLRYLKDDGFIIMHDCNPPTEFHASENYDFKLSPSKGFWNGTTWKSFFKNRLRNDISSCCIDTDWGVGIISKTKKMGEPTNVYNPFFEYKIFEKFRKESLNLISFEDFKKMFNSKS